MNEQQTTPVWDLGVRLFHWSLVILFAVAYLSEDDLMLVHVYAGYAIIVLLLLRMFWGFFGTRHAQFKDFLYTPSQVWEYLKSLPAGNPRHYLGHNPAGSWMVLALLLSLSAISWSGLEAYAAEGQGPLAGAGINLVSPAHADGYEEEDEHGEHHAGHEEGDEEFWEDVHEALAEFTLFLIFLHIAGVLVSSKLHGENLARAMLTGRKKLRQKDDGA